MNTDKMREEVEAWALRQGYEVDRETDGETYACPTVRLAWQAALFSAAAAEPVGLTPLSDKLEQTRRDLGQVSTAAYRDALALCRRLEATQARPAEAEPVGPNEITRPYGMCSITGPADDVSFVLRHLPDVDEAQEKTEPVGLTATVHDLKILPDYFEAVADGRKTFEVRRTDRKFCVGDTLRLREWTGEYTGRECARLVSYVLSDTAWAPDGCAILALATQARPDAQDAARLDWLEDQTKKSRTGVTLTYTRPFSGEGGYRVMRYHKIGAFHADARAAIDAAMASDAGDGFVRLHKASDHGKPYKSFEHAKAQAAAELAPVIAALVVREVAELPDRSSPDEWPEAMLVTADELRNIVLAAMASDAGERT